jgi:hypothetical protein
MDHGPVVRLAGKNGANDKQGVGRTHMTTSGNMKIFGSIVPGGMVLEQ